MTKPLVITMGEPSGIGGELSLKAYLDRRKSNDIFFVLGCPQHLLSISKAFSIDVSIQEITTPQESVVVFPDALPVLPLRNSVSSRLGVPSTDSAAAVIESIERATELAKSNEVSAVVTNPIQKSVLYDVGFSSPGHTEFIAGLCNVTSPVMMLASPNLRVVPVTVHLPLVEALHSLTTESIVEHGQITISSLRRDFGIERPRLAVAGVNPHAGENRSLGTEDEDIVMPAIRILSEQNAEISGPVPPDALFTPRARMSYDAALCMYHDQALIPIKALDFDHAVNVTIGLPIVRTSPDHGTALDIAEKGVADPTSLLSAISLASEIATSRAENQ